jgi:predicted dehydrogenase
VASTLRFGVLGAAKIALEHVVPAMQGGDRTQVVALASRDPARASEAARRLGIGRVHAGYEDLLVDPDVDAVYLPLPNHLHAPWAIAAARAGKHVLCEKPMALDADEARRMLAATADAGVVFMEAFMYRLHPQWVRAIELVRSGALGDVRVVQIHFAYHNADPANIRNVAAWGGGALMDIGCYGIDVARWVFDAEPTVVAGAIRTDPAFGTDVVSSAVLGFPGGGQATFACSTQCAPHQHVTIAGTDARLDLERPFNAWTDRPLRLHLTRGDGPAEVLSVDPQDQYRLQGDAFAAAVLDGAPVPVPPGTGPAVLDVIARIRASAGVAATGAPAP